MFNFNSFFSRKLECFFFSFFVLFISYFYGQPNLTNAFYKTPINLNIQDLQDFSRYTYIDSCIKDARIVFLGESSHTSKEYSQAKYKLIKYLHEKHGYDVVLFESGISDCFYSNTVKNSKDSTWLLKNSIFPIWWCPTTSSLMNYLKNQQITFGGFDYQRSSNAHSSFIRMLSKIDTLFISDLYKLDTAFSNFSNRNYPPLSKQKLEISQIIQAKLKNSYEKLDQQLSISKNEISSIEYEYYKRIISNRLFFIENYPDLAKINALRDSIMSYNLLWFIDSIYQNNKIIVWGANDHIAKHRSGVSKDFYAASTLPDRIKRQSYTIGLYAYSGQMYSYPSNFDIKKPKEISLEGRIHNLGGDTDVFLDLKHNSNTDFKWISQKVDSYHWGTLIDKIVPIKWYDGIILINKVTLSKNYSSK
ncbi:MAG TPA: erythromycin esterase family protein [Bacteroidia bacterium]|nr:erythromycin esterase family protein [Bacteroidia bacterium]